MEKRVIIMRGIPGSGKSSMARFLSSHTKASIVHSTDDYFIINGEYRFDPACLGQNHAKNLEAFKASIDKGAALVILDNTNTQKWEYEKYEKYAKEAGYWVSFCVMPHPTPEEAFQRNTHGVPLSAIKRMIARFE